MPYTADLPLVVREAMGMGARVNMKTPVVTMSISVHKLTFTVQPDGQVAIFNPDRLIGCECQGEPVFDIPNAAKLIVGFSVDSKSIHIFQDGEQFYTARGERATKLKIYGPTIKADRSTDQFEEESEEECAIFHTSSDDLEDYYKVEEDAGDHSPIPRWGQPDQVENDPKEGR